MKEDVGELEYSYGCFSFSAAAPESPFLDTACWINLRLQGLNAFDVVENKDLRQLLGLSIARKL